MTAHASPAMCSFMSLPPRRSASTDISVINFSVSILHLVGALQGSYFRFSLRVLNKLLKPVKCTVSVSLFSLFFFFFISRSKIIAVRKSSKYSGRFSNYLRRQCKTRLSELYSESFFISSDLSLCTDIN